MVDVRPLSLDGLIEVRPKRFADERGYFSEVWNAAAFASVGIDAAFVQDNQSLSRTAGVIRGLHFQHPPKAQDKLIRVIRGSIYDVAVDIRSGSSTYGRWAGLELSAESGNQLFVPRGFAHGFMTLEPDTEVLYKVSAAYSPEHEAIIRYDDPAIGIDWPNVGTPILSRRDAAAPLLANLNAGF